VRQVTEAVGNAASLLHPLRPIAKRLDSRLHKRLSREGAMTVVWLAIAFFAGSIFGLIIVAFGRAAAEPVPQLALQISEQFADETADRHLAA
jgi:hypothetical protein